MRMLLTFLLCTVALIVVMMMIGQVGPLEVIAAVVASMLVAALDLLGRHSQRKNVSPF